MAQVSQSAARLPHKAETTFKNYNADDAAKYAKYRQNYAPYLIEQAIQTHEKSGGQLDRVLDIGCGPGTATAQIAPFFKHVIGIDASPSMIDAARKTECLSSTGEQATFEICSSEEIDKYEPNSIDMITAATAAHWFDMPRFYTAASKVLKPSGSIAIWTTGRWFADPATTPHLEKTQAIWERLEFEIIKPYEHPSLAKTHNLYEKLDLPWTIHASEQTPEIQTGLKAFDESASFRFEFNKDGTPDPRPEFAATGGYLKFQEATLTQIGAMLGTASSITRWREANKEAVEKGEKEDCVEWMLKEIRTEMAKAGPEYVGREWVKFGVGGVLIVIKKKAE